VCVCVCVCVMWYMHTGKFSFSQPSFLDFFCLCQSSPKQNFRIINAIWHMLECYKDHIVEYVFLLFCYFHLDKSIQRVTSK